MRFYRHTRRSYRSPRPHRGFTASAFGSLLKAFRAFRVAKAT